MRETQLSTSILQGNDEQRTVREISHEKSRLAFRLVPGLVVFLCLGAHTAWGQPLINENGVVNAASFMPPTLPNGGIAQGSIFSIFGVGLGPEERVEVLSFPLETTLAGVAVTITREGESVSALPLSVGALQINAIMPSNAPLGEVEVTVTFDEQTSPPVTAIVVNSSVGIFTATGRGSGPGSVTNFNTAADQPLNTSRVTAQRGQVVTLWATGLGPIDAPDNERPVDVGAVTDLRKGNASVKGLGANTRGAAIDLEVLVGDVLATNVLYAGRSAEFAGLDQISLEIPFDAPEGCFVPVSLTTDGVPGNTVTIAVGADGQPCSDPSNPLSQAVISGGRLGSVLLVRAAASLRIAPIIVPLDFTLDSATASFTEMPGGEIAFDPFFSLPPVGSCSTVAVADLDITSLLGGDLPDVNIGETLDAGPELSITRADGTTKTISRQDDETYTGTLGGGLPFGPTEPLFLDPGMFTIEGPGGEDVGPFVTDVVLPPAIVWTNRDQLAMVNRALGVTFMWEGGDASQLLLAAGGNIDSETGATGAFFCLVAQSAGQFSVPPLNLSIIPSTAPGTVGFLLLGSVPVADFGAIEAAGLDSGLVGFLTLDLRTSSFE